MRKKLQLLGAVALVLCAHARAARAEPARSSLRSSSTLSFWFGDDDILHDDALSPAPDIGDRPGFSLLADGRSTRNTGRESLSELALELTSAGYFRRVETSAELRAWIDWNGALARGSQAPAFEDASSYLRVSYLVREQPRWSLDATAYPIDADRVRLGFLRDLSWGGSDVRRDESVFPGLVGTAPAVSLGFDSPRAACWLGLKTARLSEPTPQAPPRTATSYGALGGVSARAGLLRVDLELGGFEQGRFATAAARGARRLVLGSSARLTLAEGPSAPHVPGLFTVGRLPAEIRWGRVEPGWAVSLEASVLAQRLVTPDGGVALVPERGAALVASVAAEGPWLALLGEYRDVMFVVRNAPGLIASETLPYGARARPELSGVLELGYRFSALHLAPSVELGARWPATVSGPGPGGARILRIEGPSDYLPLLPGQTLEPVLAARAGLAADVSELLDALGWLDYESDENRPALVGSAHSGRKLGLGVGLRARF